MFENKVYPGIREMLARLRMPVLRWRLQPQSRNRLLFILEHFDLLSYFTLVGGADMERSGSQRRCDCLYAGPSEQHRRNRRLSWWWKPETRYYQRMKISSHVRQCCMDGSESLRKMGQTTRLRRWKTGRFPDDGEKYKDKRLKEIERWIT